MDKKTITIMDYRNLPTKVELDMEDVARIMIRVISGDEQLFVIYKDYQTDAFESSFDRSASFMDYEYEVYNVITGTNLLEDPKWLARPCSYAWEFVDE